MGSRRVVRRRPTSHIRFGAWDGARGQAGIESALKTAVGYSGDLLMFARGYSGNTEPGSHPSSFASSSVSAAATGWNNGAMLNVKNNDWAAAANGDYVATWQSFWNSWPANVWGRVYHNHEPSDDGKLAQAADYRAGTALWYDTARAIIVSRGLNVKCGGLHMLFDYTAAASFRWTSYKWWESVTAPLDCATFGLDGYSTTDPGPTPELDILDELAFAFAQARAAGFPDFSLGETAQDRRQTGHKTDVPIEPWLIGTDDTQREWLDVVVPTLEAEYPELSAVNHFHSPTGSASAYAQLNTVALTRYAQIVRDGKRG